MNYYHLVTLVTDQDQVWHDNEPMEFHTLDSLMANTSKEASLSQHDTNHLMSK